MTKKLIDLYKEWMITGEMPHFPGGLCHNVPLKYMTEVNLFIPQKNEFDSYWGADTKIKGINKYYGFGTLRQTIVLFICAMHNEL